jgi:hypothetical protein
VDDDDQSAAEAHQQELEQRELEERCRRLRIELRDETRLFERETNEHHERVRRLYAEG